MLRIFNIRDDSCLTIRKIEPITKNGKNSLLTDGTPNFI